MDLVQESKSRLEDTKLSSRKHPRIESRRFSTRSKALRPKIDNLTQKKYRSSLQNPFSIHLHPLDSSFTTKALDLLGKITSKIKIDDQERKPINLFHKFGFVCGLNAVTRSLEKNLIALVCIAKLNTPRILFDHLPVQCRLASATLLILNIDSVSLGQLFSLQRVIAFGIARSSVICNDDDFIRIFNELSSLAPTIEIGWLEEHTYKPPIILQSVPTKEYNRDNNIGLNNISILCNI